MKWKKQYFFLLIVSIIFVGISFANDPPHNDASDVSCGECHGVVLFSTDPGSFTPDELTDAYNNVCLRCHTDTSGSYHGTAAPAIANHDSATTGGRFTFKTGCLDCHHPHFQDQFWEGRKFYGTEYRLFVANGSKTGTLTNPNRTIITYTPATLFPKSGSTWDTSGPPDNDPEIGLANLADKTGSGRGAVFLPNTNSPYNGRMIESIDTDANTITVKGSLSSVSTAGFAIALGQVIKKNSPYPSASGTTIIYLDHTGTRSFAHNDGLGAGGIDSTVTGVCQVCHTKTLHWRNNGWVSVDDNGTPDNTSDDSSTGVAHFGGTNCMNCHNHAGGGFKPNYKDHYDTSTPYVTDYSNGGPATSNETCISCHSSPGTYKVDRDYVIYVHNSTCNNCHINFDSPPTMTGGANGSAVGRDGDNSCSDCHGTVGGFNYNTDFEGAHDVKDHDGLVVSANCSTTCHTTDIVNLDATPDVHNDNCTNCHTSTGPNGTLKNGANGYGDASGHLIGTTSSCEDCHALALGGPGGDFDGGSHSDYDHSGVVGTSSATPVANCNGCHDGTTGPNIVANTHGSTCTECHSNIGAAGTLIAGNDGYGSAAGHTLGSTSSCADCHSARNTNFETHTHGDAANHKTGGSGTTIAQGGTDVSQEFATPCSACHRDLNGGATTLTTWDEIAYEHDLDGTKDGVGSCVTCHNATRDVCIDGGKCATGVNTIQSIIAANGDPTGCVACHVAKIDSLSSDATHGGHDDSQFAWAGGCENCHGAGAAAEAVVSGIHTNSCNLCHQTGGPYNAGTEKLGANGDGDARLANGDAGTWTSTCVTCHNQTQVPGFHGVAIGEASSSHQLSSDFSGGYNCEECHTSDAANEQLNTHMDGTDTPAQCATICHGRTTPSNTSGIVAKTVIDDVTFNDPAPNQNDTKCEECHAAKGDYKLHGLTDDDSAADGIDDNTGGVAWHNNLGGSKGAWADSGGTIPASRAAGYTGKIDTANALIDDDYNCADCHDAERTSFTSLEAMQVHTFNLGSGSGNCLTCHGASMVADEISAGTGGTGTTVECEDCHSIANGNGPSGEKMYQYDGIRHHKTVHAQTGNCTRCHADPRPADLSAEPGFAGTAAVNDGVIDNDGITWDDGFDDDFGLNYTHPGGMPRQMGCRLCHSNYETYTVDVKAEIDTDWDTTELSDKHGYNKTPPAHGLTIYANDFDARGTSLTYQDSSNLHEIRGAPQTTQTSIASHRIDATDGSSKINVYNYGACLSCHTVQIRHAAPRPDPDTDYNNSDEDYDTPVYGFTAVERNTHPYDTLRYSPGRSVFNDFRGTNGDAWNNHRKILQWLFIWPSAAEFSRRGGQVFRDADNDPSFAFYDDINNYSATSLVAVPVDANVNDLESLPGMGATQNIRNFDTGPAIPDIDDITITVADWTGSAVYVEATSSIGSGQNFSFTYTGAGGPCNTAMAWDGAKYVGNCIAASGYTGTDTVTVSNNTTPVPDEVTRSLTDRTINPVLPVINSIELADNDGTDPAPAESVQFTNDDDGEVEVRIDSSNYPTEMRLSESATFNGDTDPWIPYDAVTTFTFSNTVNEDKTVYCQVRNGAGQALLQKDDLITLDTTDPAIQADTLTAPNGGDFWPQGSSQTITWDELDISDANLKADPVFLKYSLNGGSTWPGTIANDEANDSSHAWTVNATITFTAKVKITVRDKAGNEASDTSDNNFTIAPFVVINTNDSGAGSLRQAIIDVETAGGNNQIWFNIPVGLLTNGVAVIDTLTDLPPITQDGIRIDGGSQTTLKGDTNPNGPEIRINKAGTSTTGLTVSGDSLYIYDLQITGFSTGINSTGYDTSMESSYFGFYSDSTGYGSASNTNNALLSGSFPNVYNQNYFACASTGLNLSGSSDAWVNGNTFGMYPDDTPCANTTGINISAAATDAAIENNTISSSSTGIYLSNADNTTIDKNIISGGTYGIHLGVSSDDIAITGNQIGIKYNGATWDDLTDPSSRSIYVQSSGVNNVIGGSNVALSDANLRDSNVIDPQGYGIYLSDDAEVYGNFIGTNPEQDEVASGSKWNGSGGVRIESSGSDSIIGSAAEAGNVISNMSFRGVYLGSSFSDRVKISRNLIYNNGSEAALSDDGIDGAAGALITRPTIFAVTSSSVTVEGVTNGSTVEVYLSDYDGTGNERYGEGKEFIGSAVASGTSVTVDISGWGTLGATDWVSAIWFLAANDTSPFSANEKMPGPAVPTLDWTGDAGYAGDGVEPDSDISGSSFEFRVEYTDADNDPPQTIEVWVDEDDSNSYEADEKFVMTEVAPADTDYTDGKDYTLTRTIELRAGGTIDYRFYATDGLLDATGSPVTTTTFTIVGCGGRPIVDAAGTYFEAENFTSTIVQGSATFSEVTNRAGYNGTGALLSSGSSLATPPTQEGKVYEVDFSTTGTYKVWIRGYNDYGASFNSVFVGLDGAWTGALTTTTLDTWEWSNTVEAGVGVGTITVGSAGYHTVNIWVRENLYWLDGIYLIKVTGSELDPTDGTVPSGATVIDPSLCVEAGTTVAGTATASVASTSSIDVSMPYTYDNDFDNTYTVEYKLSSSGTWLDWGTNPKAHTVSPYTDTITGLTPGESYDVRMTYNDSIGVYGTNPQTVSGIVLPLVSTTAGTATASMANTTSIDVSMPYTDDDNGNNTYTVDYRCTVSTGGAWTNWVTNDTHTASPYTNTITGRTPGETCDVRMTYNDADGVNGTNPQTVSSINLDYVVRNVSDSGEGSLRQKLTTLISNGGSNTISFNIPVGLLTSGVAVINVPTALPQISANSITIDGTSQTTNVGDTNSYGPEVLIDGPGIASVIAFQITGNGAIIKGLQIADFHTGINTTGADTEIHGNYFGYTVNDTPTYTTKANRYNIRLYDADAIVGSSAAADRNYITNGSTYGVEIDGATGTKLINNAIGLRSDNTLAANGSIAVRNIGSSGGQIEDNVFIGSGYGLYISAYSSTGNVIKGNTFGVYYNAGVWTSLGGQTTAGIRMDGGSGNIIGGPTVATDDATLNDSNVFDPDTNDIGIYLWNPEDYASEIYNNFIGTNPEQDETFGGRYGIQIDYPTGVTIDGNVIANMSIYGVWLQFPQANYVQLSQNSFYNNGNNSGDDAIYLNGTSNNSITRPTIDSATTTTVSVSNVFGGDGADLAGDIVEVYIADFTGTENGEGRTFVTSAVVPYGSGVDPNDTVNVDVTGLVSSGDWLTVTRTNHNTAVPWHQTSAFSTNVQVP